MKLTYTCVVCAFCDRVLKRLYGPEVPVQSGEEVPYLCRTCGKGSASSIVSWVVFETTREEPERVQWFLEEHRVRAEETPEWIEDYSAFVVPKKRYPVREWFTLREVEEKTGVPKKTIQSWIHRRKLFDLQMEGWIQDARGTYLLHEKAVERVQRLKNEIGRGRER